MRTRKFLMAMAAAGPLLWASGASAVQIEAGSELSLNGSDTFDANSVNFVNPANIGGETDSFASAELTNCSGCATMTSFTSSTSTPFQLYTATSGGATTTLMASSDSFSFQGGTLPSLTVNGTGSLDLTGFDPTPGSWVLTTQEPSNVAVTFNLPDPGSLVLLGTGLAGLGCLARRRRG